MKETEVAQFPARIAVRDNLRYGVVTTIMVALFATIGYFLVMSTAPKGAEVYSSMIATVTGAFAFYFLYKVVSRHAAKNERNRLHFSQLLRNTAWRELTAVLSLEATELVASGRAVRVNGYDVWLKKHGRTVSLMTNKTIGIRQLQNL